MLYCPYMWIRSSKIDMWAGWGRQRKGKHLYFVRKPNPSEELSRKGYFMNSAKMQPRKIQNKKKLQWDYSVYQITELKRTYQGSWDSDTTNVKRRKIMITTNKEDLFISSLLVDDELELVSDKNVKGLLGIQPLPMIKNAESIDTTEKKGLTVRPLLEMLGVQKRPASSPFGNSTFNLAFQILRERTKRKEILPNIKV